MGYQDINIFNVITQGTYGFIFFTLIILSVILAVLWILLPFAVFKMKTLLSDANLQLMRMNKYLISIEGSMRDIKTLVNEHNSAHDHAHEQIAHDDAIPMSEAAQVNDEDDHTS